MVGWDVERVLVRPEILLQACGGRQTHLHPRAAEVKHLGKLQES